MITTSYSSFDDAMEKLKKRGFKYEFKVKNNKLQCLQTGRRYGSGDLNIIEKFRFSNSAIPGAVAVAFAITCQDGNMGTVVVPYGSNGNDGILKFMKNVKTAARAGVKDKHRSGQRGY